MVAIFAALATIQIATAAPRVFPGDFSPITDDEGVSRLFAGRVIEDHDLPSNVSVYKNGTLVQYNESVPSGGEVDYTAIAMAGVWEINMTACNEEGCDSYVWLWTVNDTTPPSINNVTLNTTSLYTGQPILVTVSATDSVGVTNVSANGTLLSAMGGNIWQGTITALRGTHTVNVSASDAAGNAAWNNSTSYTATNTIVASIDKSVYLPGENITLSGRVYSDYGDGLVRINVQCDDSVGYDTTVTAGVFSTVFSAPSGDYCRMAILFDDGTSTSIDFEVDGTPPASVTGLVNNSYAQNYINWIWTDPGDADFDKVMVYLNGSFQTNVTKGTQFYNATGLSADTEYIISTRTVDTAGNINATWENRTARTAPPPDITPPSIQSLRITNITNTSAVISWATNEAARSTLKYGTTSGSYPSNITGSSSTTSHTFALTGLSPSTKHYFKANSTDASGNSAESVEYNFTTASSFIERTITTIGNRTNVTSGSGNTTLNITTNNSVANAPINITEHAANPVSSSSIVRSGSIVSAPSINKFVEIEASSELRSNLSVITIRVNYSGSDLTGIDESSLRLYWWNESASVWDALDESGVDTANKIVWGNVTHLSLFGVFDGSSDDSGNSGSSSGSGGGGGGGGGGGASGENASNILVKEKYDLHIFKDKTTAYRFTNSSNPVKFVNITGNISAGEITVAVEVLKSTSTLVNVTPPGAVYKNMNIWVGTSGFAVPRNIKKATVEFDVNRNWIAENSIKSITLLRYDTNNKEWVSLPTARIGESSAEEYYQGETDSFSSFAISGEKAPVAALATPVVAEETPVSTEQHVKHGDTTASILSTLLGFALPSSDRTPAWTYTAVLLGIVGALSIKLFLLKRKNSRLNNVALTFQFNNLFKLLRNRRIK